MDLQRLTAGLAAFAVVAVGAGTAVAAGRADPAPAAAAVGTPMGQDVTLGLGQEALVWGRDLSVRYTRVVSDSRCPAGVTCVWAGEATLAFLLREPGRGESTTAELHSGPGTGPRATTFAATRVELVSVSPDGRAATVRVG